MSVKKIINFFSDFFFLYLLGSKLTTGNPLASLSLLNMANQQNLTFSKNQTCASSYEACILYIDVIKSILQDDSPKSTCELFCVFACWMVEEMFRAHVFRKPSLLFRLSRKSQTPYLTFLCYILTWNSKKKLQGVALNWCLYCWPDSIINSIRH